MYKPAANPSASPSQTPLNPADLDEDVVQTVREMIEVLLDGKETPTPAETTEAAKAKRETGLQKRLRENFKLPMGWRVTGQAAGWVLWLSVLSLLMAVIIALGGDYGLTLCVPPLFGVAAGWLGVHLVGKEQKRFQGEQALTPAVLLRVLPLLDRENGLQAAYCDAVSALLKQEAAWGPNATQDILRDLKDLLHTGKQTASRRAEIEQAMSHQSLADGETEAAHLAERADTATDPSARETFKQSLALLEARLTRAKSLEPLRQQLEAQEEVIRQALAEAQSALSGASLAQWASVSAGAAATATAGGVPLAHLGDTVSRLRSQTESVENAVREVMAVQTLHGR